MYRKNKVIKIAVSVKMDWHVARHERSEVGENLTRGCENQGFRGVWYDGVGKTCPMFSRCHSSTVPAVRVSASIVSFSGASAVRVHRQGGVLIAARL